MTTGLAMNREISAIKTHQESHSHSMESQSQSKDSADLTDTSGSSDGSIGSTSKSNDSSSDSKKSMDLWVQACEEQGAYSTNGDTDFSDTEGVSQKITSVCFPASSSSATQEERLIHPPESGMAGEDEPILPVCEEEEATSMHDDEEDNLVAAGNSSPHSETGFDSLIASYEEIQKQDEQTAIPGAQGGERSTSQDEFDEDSTILNSDRRFQRKNKEDRFSGVTFSGTNTPQTSSEFLTNNSNESTASSERWKDNAKAHGLPTVNRRISEAKGDCGPPKIPSRMSFDGTNTNVTPPAAIMHPKKPILKASIDEEIPVKVKTRYWKKLPPPDLVRIKEMRQELLDFLLSQEEEVKNVPVPPPNSFVRRCQSEGFDVQGPLMTLIEGSKSEGGKPNVQFEYVIIRQYQQTIGDNPSVSYGTPISLDWAYMENEPLDLDVYEANKTKRTMRQMFLNHYQRKNIFIHRYGFSPAEVKAAKRATNKVKSQREFSKVMQTSLKPLLVLEEMRESAVRKAKRRMSKDSYDTDISCVGTTSEVSVEK
ncbi:MAG: hypothetical protein SGBAC_002949 [Bacillariaceae sp.]